MVRHVAAIVVALCISPAWAGAQTTTITVSALSAEVYAGPSTASRLIGRVPRGTVLVVTRDLGSWVKVQWSSGQNAVGYMHVSKGTIGHGSQTGSGGAVASAPRSPASRPAQAASRPAPPAVRPMPPPDPPAPSRAGYITPPNHTIGVGGIIAAPNAGFGASARAWRPHNRLGIQVDVSHYAVTSATLPGRVTSLQFEPSGIYSLPDRLTDYWWLRPYAGAGVSVQRQTFTNGTLEPVHDSGLGFHAFGGGEVTFASIPRFTVGVDVGYRWLPTPFAGFESDGFGISLSGRWYIR